MRVKNLVSSYLDDSDSDKEGRVGGSTMAGVLESGLGALGHSPMRGGSGQLSPDGKRESSLDSNRSGLYAAMQAQPSGKGDKPLPQTRQPRSEKSGMELNMSGISKIGSPGSTILGRSDHDIMMEIKSLYFEHIIKIS